MARTRSRGVKGKTFARKRDAERFLIELESSKHHGTYLDPHLGKTTLNQWWDRYAANATHLKPTTRETYRFMASRYLLPHLGSKPLASISRLDVEGWVGRLKLDRVGSPTIRASHQVLCRVLQTATEAGVIGRNPAVGVKVPKANRAEMRFLSPAEIRRIADAVQPRYRALIRTLAYTGLRIGEAAALRVDNLDLLRGRIHVVEAFQRRQGPDDLGSDQDQHHEVSDPAWVPSG